MSVTRRIKDPALDPGAHRLCYIKRLMRPGEIDLQEKRLSWSDALQHLQRIARDIIVAVGVVRKGRGRDTPAALCHIGDMRLL